MATEGKTEKRARPEAPKPRSEGRAARRRRAKRILAKLREQYPVAECALHHDNPFQLTVATILSAQCTDKTVNEVTPALFARYPGAGALSRASLPALEKLVYSTGFFRNKAKNLKAMAKAVHERHGGEIPRTMDELLELPGVARKTANVVLGTAFGIAEGVVVDTHVQRLTQRLGMTREKSPVAIERDLIDTVPRHEWIYLSHALIWHGRKVCDARKPLCGECHLRRLCPSAR